jgi:hypothetical protein
MKSRVQSISTHCLLNQTFTQLEEGYTMNAPRLLQLAALALAIVASLVSYARADQIHFPPAPADLGSAAASFDERATIVTRYNACGRELDYSTHRREQLDENYENQGEGLTSILIAKTAWLTDPRFAELPCEYQLKVPRPKNPDGSFVHPTAEAFMVTTLGSWNDINTPTRCSFPTSQVNVSEEQLSVKFHVEPACLRQQVNEAIRAMVKDRQMGTDSLPCFTGFNTGNKGDFDVNVRELVRIFYMGTIPRREVLERSTIDYMYENLLAARGGLSDASYSVLSDCDDPAGDELGSPEDFADREYWYNELLEGIGDFFKWLAELFFKVTGSALASAAGIAGAPFIIAAGEDPIELALPHTDIRVPETENHRLMIETSKYLTNAKILAELRQMAHDNVDEIEEKQNEVRNWLLQTLQSVTINDFDEYNSRPYTRYSLNAILNLHDFAEDSALRTASQIVLDLSGAKFATGSNRGRRIVPFRRLADNDDKPLYEMVSGADHEVARAVVLAGQTQLLGGGVVDGGVSNMVYAAVSPYRWPRPVLEVAIERKRAFEQDIRHDGVEGYYSSPAFTMSLGGIRRPSALDLLGFERSVDRGVAMPTVIIPTTAGHFMTDLFAMNGNGFRDKRTDNLCGWQGFICGIQPTLSSAYSQCTIGTVTSSGPDYFFINSAACAAGGSGPHFYLAFKRGYCDDTFCEHGRQYGLMEIVEASAAQPAPDAAFQAFQATRRSALEAAVPDANGFGTYVNTSGQSIRFVVNDGGSRIVDVNGATRRSFATRGDVINAEGDGRAVIGSPWSPAKVVIEYTRWDNPQRGEIP